MTELTATVVIESLLRATADDATPIIRRLARNQARVFLDSRAGDAGEGLVLPPGWKPWTGGPFTPQDYAGRYMLRNRSFHDWRPGNGAGPSWKWEYGEGDIVAYLATPAPAVDAVPAGEVLEEPDWANAATCIENMQIAYDNALEADPFDDGNPIPTDTVVDAGDLGVLIGLARYAAALSHGEGRK